MWRPEDEILLQRLEDESAAEALFRWLVGGSSEVLSARASGLVGELRKLPGGAEAVAAALAGDVERLAAFIDRLVLRELRPELLHHLALFHRRAALALESAAPEPAATAWVRSLAAWLALAEERTYLTRLEDAVLGADAQRPGRAVAIPPEQVPLEIAADIARRAEASARDLAPPGRAALAALARIDDAARLAGVPAESARRVHAAAERLRNGAIESALAVIAEALDEANVRGELATSGPTLLLRAIPVWTWTSNDEAVEHFVVDRIDKVGWELHRAKNWDALRYMLDPFRPIFEALARRIEADPSRISYAAGCAQMFVFLSEVERISAQRLLLAERAVKVCPTHRNGRVVLAAALCEQALEAMRTMSLFAARRDIDFVEKLLERAESLHPQTTDLPEAKRVFERVKRSSIKL